MTACALADRTLRAFLADPDREPDAHLRDCAECTAAAQEARTFEQSLHAAAGRLVTESLPPAYRLLGPRPSRAGASGWPSRLGPMRAVRSVASLAMVVALAGALIAFRSIAGSGHGVTPGVQGTAAATTATQATATPTASCETAFAGWISAWEASGRADYSMNPILTTAETEAALRVFSSCTLDTLRQQNVRQLVDAPSPHPLLPGFDKTIVVVCLSDDVLEATATCQAALSQGGGLALYKVRPGDTLTAIAMKLGTSLEALLQANPWITDPDVIYVGDVLVVPASAANPSAVPLPGLTRPQETPPGAPLPTSTAVASP